MKKAPAHSQCENIPYINQIIDTSRTCFETLAYLERLSADYHPVLKHPSPPHHRFKDAASSEAHFVNRFLFGSSIASLETFQLRPHAPRTLCDVGASTHEKQYDGKQARI